MVEVQSTRYYIDILVIQLGYPCMFYGGQDVEESSTFSMADLNSNYPVLLGGDPAFGKHGGSRRRSR